VSFWLKNSLEIGSKNYGWFSSKRHYYNIAQFI
jgi:hypothetical protein